MEKDSNVQIITERVSEKCDTKLNIINGSICYQIIIRVYYLNNGSYKKQSFIFTSLLRVNETKPLLRWGLGTCES